MYVESWYMWNFRELIFAISSVYIFTRETISLVIYCVLISHIDPYYTHTLMYIYIYVIYIYMLYIYIYIYVIS